MKECLVCGKEFEPNSNNHRFCDIDCRKKSPTWSNTKEYRRKAAKKRWWENLEKSRAYRRKSYRKHKEKRNAYNKEWYQNNKDSERYRNKRKEISARYYRNNKDKVASRKKALRALRAGKIERQDVCQICGKEPVNMHHEDYKKPLEVMWLCKKCHIESHQALSEVRKIIESLKTK